MCITESQIIYKTNKRVHWTSCSESLPPWNKKVVLRNGINGFPMVLKRKGFFSPFWQGCSGLVFRCIEIDDCWCSISHWENMKYISKGELKHREWKKTVENP